MDFIILIPLSMIIFLILVWIIEIPALLVKIYQNWESWEQVSGSIYSFAFSPIFIGIIGGTLLIFGISLAIIVFGFIVLIPVILVLLPVGLIFYRWYQLGEMMLEISDVMYKGFRNRNG